ncbi:MULTISPECIES: hypothetical protein [unclassified Modestobacter]|uniref:hypothetical protein n=1 Tax=unclassified Modestobacter TaxID=2643866 RepID=UPI0022AA48EA|nr:MULTISPECIES: hypothetical protein [unclassified Modestobacter]MCZ2823898.1 hypothetical protein [Modestobacter sp. VKM Ac-2981]MCZ2852143.1 hypothetical protein [Modestobacter sp. VKM Ac-2982]
MHTLPAPAAGLRPATPADLPALARLQDAAQAGADVAMPHPAARLRWLVAHEASTTWVLERDSAVVASVRVPEPDDDVLVAEPTAVDDAAAARLLAGVAALAAGRPVRVTDRPGSFPGRAWADGWAPCSSARTGCPGGGRTCTPAVADLDEALFPPLHADLLTYYLPY